MSDHDFIHAVSVNVRNSDLGPARAVLKLNLPWPLVSVYTLHQNTPIVLALGDSGRNPTAKRNWSGG